MTPDLALRKTEPTADPDAKKLSAKEETEREIVNMMMAARERYAKDRAQKENEWTESYKMYMSWVDITQNPYLSNLFIPKTHEAVELLSAFLAGKNQTISSSPENGHGDVIKSQVVGRWLEWIWRKQLEAWLKVLTWVKQAIVFGNGIAKFGWDPIKKKPWMNICAIEDVYFDYYEPVMQESEYIFHEVRRPKADVMADEKYDLTDENGKLIREQVIEGGTSSEGFAKTALFSTYDGSMRSSQCDGKVLVLEAWCMHDDKLKTLLPTSNGWRLARDTENPNHYNDPQKTKFAPFSKMRFKVSPVPSRAYDTGAVWPTVKIQKAFNGLINEYLDNVQLVNNKMWIKRRGARINPAELVRRPGGVITVPNILTDLKSEETSDVKASIVEMLNRLDNEFQQASMVVNLLKAIQSDGATATEINTGQENIQTLLDMLDQNIEMALSEAGQMVLAITLGNAEGVQSVKVYENDNEIGMLDFDPSNIDGVYDLKIAPDRSSSNSSAVLAKQMIDFLSILSKDPATLAKYPSLPEKVYKRWMEVQKIPDPEYFFEEMAPTALPGAAPEVDPATGLPRLPAPGEQLSTPAIRQAAGVVG